jgi:hypothetical protein
MLVREVWEASRIAFTVAVVLGWGWLTALSVRALKGRVC